VIYRSRALLLWALTMIGAGGLAGGLPAHAAGPAPAGPPVAAPPGAVPPSAPDPRLLDEMEKDVQRFAGMVTEYRSTAREILKRAYHDKAKAINAKYDPQINLNDREARDRRRDAIAMFEAFLLKYPNDKRWTPDAMFRLAGALLREVGRGVPGRRRGVQEGARHAQPARHAAAPGRLHADDQPLPRLLTEFPSYRFLDAAYYLLGFCLGEMGEEQQAKQALLALVCSNRFKPLDTPGRRRSRRRGAPGRRARPPTRSSTRSARRSVRSRSSSPRRGRASASSTSTTRTS
jgi:hypothetical protein